MEILKSVKYNRKKKSFSYWMVLKNSKMNKTQTLTTNKLKLVLIFRLNVKTFHLIVL